jgi:hypothetical protein
MLKKHHTLYHLFIFSYKKGPFYHSCSPPPFRTFDKLSFFALKYKFVKKRKSYFLSNK